MSFAQLEAFVFDKVSASRLAGLSMAVVQGGDITWARGFGYRNLENGLAATPHTLYSVGSVTKSFTALAIMQLAEQGRLSVDDPVEKHIPTFTLRPGGESVRLWHFLSHSSGIPALAYAESMIRGVIGAGENWLPIATPADLITFMADAGDWTLNRPGERYFYLNEGYVLLGHIVEQCSGMSYTQYVTEHILKPLEMTRSFFAKAAVEGDPDAATPYYITRDRKRLPSTYAYGSITADGGLVSHVLDLANYVRMYLGNGAYNGTRLVSAASVEAMQTPRVNTPYQNDPFGDAGYGYGLRITPDFRGHRLVGHGGSVGTATAYIGFIPARQVGVAVLANGSGYPMEQVGFYGLALALGLDPDELPFVQRENWLEALEGTYETYRGTVQMQVRQAGDFLLLEEHDRYTDSVIPLVPEVLEEERRVFYTLGRGSRLPVEFRVQGEQVELIYERYLLRRTGKPI